MSMLVGSRLVALAVLASLVVGCSGGRPDEGSASCVPARDAAAALGGARTGGVAVAIAARDDRFEPSCIEVPATGPVTLVVRNDGHHPHNLTLADGSSVAVDAAQVAILAATVTGELLTYVCTIHAGMRGELRVAR